MNEEVSTITIKKVKVPDNCPKSTACSVLSYETREKLKDPSEIDAWNANYPTTKNSVVFTGIDIHDDTGKGKVLIIVDFDRVKNNADQQKFDFFCIQILKTLNIPKEELYVVQTGSGGYHAYFYVQPSYKKIGGKKYKILNPQIKQEYFIDGIDILGEGQLAFGDGSDFTGYAPGHTQPYEKISNASLPPTLSQEKLNKMLVVIDTISRSTTSVEYLYKITEDFDSEGSVDSLKMRLAFRWILNGKIQVSNEQFEHLQGGRGGAKFRIWAAFWGEVYSKNPEISEYSVQEIINILQETQNDFSLKETKSNLKSLQHKKTKMTSISQPTYTKYFKPWLEDLKKYKKDNKDNDKNWKDVDYDNDDYGGDDDDGSAWIVDISTGLIEGEYRVGFLVENKEFFYYTGKTYKLDSNFVCSLILDSLIEYSRKPNTQNQNQILNYIRAKNYKHVWEFDANLDLIVFDNGIYNVETKELTPHQPSVLSLKILPYNYNPNIKMLPDLTLKFLRTLDFSDEEITRLLQVSKLIVERKLQRLKYFVVAWGVTNSGKTLWGEKLARLIGKQNEDWALMRLEKFGERFALQQLPGIYFTILDDVGVEALNSKAYSMLKTLTSGGSVEFEEKHVKARTETVKAAVYCSCNQLFRLPVQEEYKTLVARAFIFHFKKSHPKNATFSKMFLENVEDNGELYSYLLNLPDVDTENISNLPLDEISLYPNPALYWIRNSNPIELICSQHLKYNPANKVELDSMLFVLQKIAIQMGLNIDMSSQWGIQTIKAYCRRELSAIIPRSIRNENNQYETWIYYVECPNARNDPISILDSTTNYIPPPTTVQQQTQPQQQQQQQPQQPQQQQTQQQQQQQTAFPGSQENEISYTHYPSLPRTSKKNTPDVEMTHDNDHDELTDEDFDIV